MKKTSLSLASKACHFTPISVREALLRNDGETAWHGVLNKAVLGIPEIADALSHETSQKWKSCAESLERGSDILVSVGQKHSAHALAMARLRALMHNQAHLASPSKFASDVKNAVLPVLQTMDGTPVPQHEADAAVFARTEALSLFCATQTDLDLDLVKRAVPHTSQARRVLVQAGAFIPDILPRDLTPLETLAVSVMRKEATKESSLEILSKHPTNDMDKCIMTLSVPECPLETLQSALNIAKEHDAVDPLVHVECLAGLARLYRFNYIYCVGLFQKALTLADAWFSGVEGVTLSGKDEIINGLYRIELVQLLRELGQRKEADSLCRRYGLEIPQQ